MGRVIVSEFVSLDGVFEDPGGAESYEHGGWTFTFDQGADGAAFKLGSCRRPTRCCSGASPTKGSRPRGRRSPTTPVSPRR